jgi:hypothetical protein
MSDRKSSQRPSSRPASSTNYRDMVCPSGHRYIGSTVCPYCASISKSQSDDEVIDLKKGW